MDVSGIKDLARHESPPRVMAEPELLWVGELENRCVASAELEASSASTSERLENMDIEELDIQGPEPFADPHQHG